MWALSRRCSGRRNRYPSRCSAFHRRRPARPSGKIRTGPRKAFLYNAVSGPGVAVTAKTLPFVEAYSKKYGNSPAYSGYTSYDEVYMIAEAVRRAGSTDSDKLVDAMEKTDYVGTIGRVAFLPKGGCTRPWPAYGAGLHHRLDAAMARRQAEEHVAQAARLGRDEVPGVCQAAAALR